MHEYGVIEALIRRFHEEPAGVLEVRVRAGPAFSPEALEQAYRILTADTPLAGSHLIVEERIARRRCPSCEAEWRVDSDDVIGHTLVCPACGTASPIDDIATLDIVRVRTAADAVRGGRIGGPVDP